ncbi:hypothetical protein AE1304_14580 [Aeromonas enteropelogenes]
MLKILVTGGAGFIDSAVVRYIIRDTQDSVTNLDKLTYAGNLESLADVSTSDRYAFEQVDICNRAELDWQPQETFESGIRKTVQWYLGNPQWVNNV